MKHSLMRSVYNIHSLPPTYVYLVPCVLINKIGISLIGEARVWAMYPTHLLAIVLVASNQYLEKHIPPLFL